MKGQLGWGRAWWLLFTIYHRLFRFIGPALGLCELADGAGPAPERAARMGEGLVVTSTASSASSAPRWAFTNWPMVRGPGEGFGVYYLLYITDSSDSSAPRWASANWPSAPVRQTSARPTDACSVLVESGSQVDLLPIARSCSSAAPPCILPPRRHVLAAALQLSPDQSVS